MFELTWLGIGSRFGDGDGEGVALGEADGVGVEDGTGAGAGPPPSPPLFGSAHWAKSSVFAAGMVNDPESATAVPDPLAAVFHPVRLYPVREAHAPLEVVTDAVATKFSEEGGVPVPRFSLYESR
jgi:hypothetical protein